MRLGIAVAIGGLLALANCATPPSQAELQTMNSAPMPTQAGAEKAVRVYFEQTLIDPESARYTYRQPRRGYLTIGNVRQFGVFMCGTINAKNRMGGYTGQQPFLAYFSPSSADYVADGSVENSSRYSIVSDWCRGIYGY